MSAPDAAIVALVLAGDRDAYATLVQRYQEPLYRHAFGMIGDSDTAADLVQDTFIRGYTRLSSCRDPERFGSWLFRILRNACLDHLKDRRRADRPLDEAQAAGVADLDDPAAHAERMEISRSVGRALAALPEAQREAFLLKHVEGRSYEEMSEMLDASVSALKMRVMRAREALQSALGARAEAGDPGM